MTRCKHKKGFTLIEMLVVIAIVAILVAIIIPVVSKSTTKAAAAANAANLRSVQGALRIVQINNPEVLENNQGQNVSTVVNSLVGTIQGLIQTAPNWRVARALGEALLTLDEEVAKNAFYASDGMLQLNGMEIAAPAAKALSVEGINIQGTTQMQVVVTEDSIVVTYNGMTAEAFAAIADEGEGGDYSNTSHTYVDSNRDNVCDVCDGSYPHTPEDIANGIVGGVVSGGHTCTDASGDGNHICDHTDCTLAVSSCDASGPATEDGKPTCSECGNLHICDHSSGLGGNTCDGCGKTQSRWSDCPNC